MKADLRDQIIAKFADFTVLKPWNRKTVIRTGLIAIGAAIVSLKIIYGFDGHGNRQVTIQERSSKVDLQGKSHWLELATTVVVSLLSGSSWSVPVGVSTLDTVRCLGGGANGTSEGSTFDGGGSGAFAESANVAVSSSVNYGVGGVAQDTWFGGTSFADSDVGAKGASGRIGGSSASSRGTTKRSGSNGGTGYVDFVDGSAGGGGAGAPGPTGSGTAGGDGTGFDSPGNGGTGNGGATAGNSGTNFGDSKGSGGGGNGRGWQFGTAQSAGNYGAGGGAAGWDPINGYGISGAGSQGLIVLSYTAAAAVEADSGSISVTGAAAEYRKTSAIVASSGVIGVSGQDAFLRKSYPNLFADQGAISVTGEPAGTVVGKKVAADAGAISVTGVAAGVTSTRRIDANAGAISVGGQAAALPVTMPADAGAISVTGVAAGVTSARGIAANQGAISVTGVAAGLRRGLEVDADAGSIAVAGQDAITRLGLKIAADRGLITVSGQAADIAINGLYPIWAQSLPGFEAASSINNSTFVAVIDPANLADLENVSHLRFKFAGACIVASAYVGHQALSGDGYDAESLVQITFDGGSAGATIGSSGTKWSDSVEFDFDPTRPLLVSYYLQGNGFAPSIYSPDAFHNVATWRDFGDFASTANKTGFSADGDLHALTAIEGSLTLGPSVIAETGAINLTGQDAAFQAIRTMPAAVGAIVVSGQPAALRKSYPALDAEAGALSVAGQIAGFLKGFKVAADPGAIAVTGVAAGTRRDKRFAAETGAISVLGVAAGLKTTMPADQGAISVLGQNADLYFRRQVAAVTGIYSISGKSAELISLTPIIAETGHYSVAGGDVVIVPSLKRRSVGAIAS